MVECCMCHIFKYSGDMAIKRSAAMLMWVPRKILHPQREQEHPHTLKFSKKRNITAIFRYIVNRNSTSNTLCLISIEALYAADNEKSVEIVQYSLQLDSTSFHLGASIFSKSSFLQKSCSGAISFLKVVRWQVVLALPQDL